MRAYIKSLLSTVLLLAAALPTYAYEKSTPMQAGEYQVHFIAFPSDFLNPEIAKAAGVERGNRIGLINISVQDLNGTPVKTTLKGHWKNLLQHKKDLEFREVTEAAAKDSAKPFAAVYYLSNFKFDPDEHMTFNIHIKPVESDKIIPLTFKWHAPQ